MSAYYKSRVVYPNRKKEARRRVFGFVLLVSGIFVFIGLLGWGFYSFTKLEKFRIRNIAVEGTRALSQDEIRVYAGRVLDGLFLFIIPKNHYVFASSRRVSDALQKEFPRIRSASVKKSFPDGIKIIVEERTEWGVFCRKISNLPKQIATQFDPQRVRFSGLFGASGASKSQISNQDTRDATTSAHMTIDEEKSACGYIDREGILFEYPLEISGSFLPVILDDSLGEIREGERVVSEDSISFFEAAQDAIKKEQELGIIVTELEISKELSDDYRLYTDEGWFVLVPRAGDMALWINSLKALLLRELKDRVGLEYVDARFGNKMFYKKNRIKN